MPPNVPESSSARCPGPMPDKCQENIENMAGAARTRDNGHYDEPKMAISTVGPREGRRVLGDERLESSRASSDEGCFDFRAQLIWSNIIFISLLHVGMVYAFLTYPFFQYKLLTAWLFFTGLAGGFGVTGGVHRFWTHRTYKANTPLKIILATCYLLAGMNSIFDWVRDHRVHHKFTETDADPHNTNRGFFFSHVGWLMLRKHPEVKRRGNQVDMSDVTEEPVAKFVDAHFTTLKILVCFFLPTFVPIYFWNQDIWATFVTQYLLRYPFTLNATWSVNSFAHFYGSREYDKSIRPAENTWVAFTAMGEGWHNYHHAFPWDYKAAELGNYRLNVTTMFIDAFAKIGWASELRTAPEKLIEKVVVNRGDGTHPSLARAALR